MLRSASKSIGYLLMHIARLHRARTARLLEGIGLFPGQEQVLEALAGREAMTVSELADLLRVRPPTASKTVSRLSAAGFVERRAGSGDGRIVQVALTPSGQERAAALAGLAATIEDEIDTHLTAKDRKRLRKLLKRVDKGLRGGPAVGSDGVGRKARHSGQGRAQRCALSGTPSGVGAPLSALEARRDDGKRGGA
jgi:DNA-binding MarR family transcriptional regulator